MSKPRAKGVAEDAGFLAFLTQAVRSDHKRFQAGSALIQSLFAVKVLRKKHAAIARELMEAFPEGHPIHEWERDNVHAFESDPPIEYDSMRLTMSDAESWVRGQPDSMERAEAEAVCLIAVALYDDNPRKNPALPKCMRSIPWGGGSAS